MFKGYIPAVVSPFNGSDVDICAFEKYINWLVESGVSGVVVCGSTGESISLSQAERMQLVRKAVEVANSRIPVIAGVISAITEDCVEQAQEFERCGADALLCVCPFYLKPTQDAIYNHFYKIHESVSIPMILYNNPGRTACDLKLDTLRKLSALPRIVGLKEASPDVARFLTWRPHLKADFSLLSGNDDTFCGSLALGAHGTISVTANVIPDICAALYKAWEDRDIEKFSRLRDKIADLHDLMFIEPSPGPVKYALSLMGIMAEDVRSPVETISDTSKAKIKQKLLELGVIR